MDKLYLPNLYKNITNYYHIINKLFLNNLTLINMSDNLNEYKI